MSRPRRQAGESCKQCTAWEPLPGEVIVGQERQGTCLCGPPKATAVIMGTRDVKIGEIITREANVQTLTAWPPIMRESQWCQQYDMDLTRLNG